MTPLYWRTHIIMSSTTIMSYYLAVTVLSALFVVLLVVCLICLCVHNLVYEFGFFYMGLWPKYNKPRELSLSLSSTCRSYKVRISPVPEKATMSVIFL